MVDLRIPDKLSIATYLISYHNYFKEMTPAAVNSSKVNNVNQAPPNKVVNQSEQASVQPPVNNNNINKFKHATSSPILPPDKPAGTWRRGGVSNGTTPTTTSEVTSTESTPPVKPSVTNTKSVPILGVGGAGGGVVGRKPKFGNSTNVKQEDPPVAMETDKESTPVVKATQPPKKVDQNFLFTISFAIILFVLANLVYMYYNM